MAPFYDFPKAYYPYLNQENVVLLESGRPDDEKNRYSYLFTNPLEILQIYNVDALGELLAAIQSHVARGKYVAGYFAYECGYRIPKLGLAAYTTERQPLAWFGVYSRPIIFDHLTNQIDPTPELEHLPPSEESDESYRVSAGQFNLTEDAYSAKIEQIKEYIRQGATYQINFTGRYRFHFEGSSIGLYKALRKKQRVSYGAYIQAAGQTILCLSPELFFRVDGTQITARPMKGTAPRGRSLAEDQQQATWLQGDEKNRAENVMIVDLLRNDLGRISHTGSVRVPDLFTIEKYGTLFQMTSTVEAELQDGLEYHTLFRSLFPCGSITGAPKIRSMSIIHELEDSPRGVYTGAIGYFGPDQRAMFNVAIRTIVLDHGQGQMGIGSGVVYDSVAADEYAECLVKARFLTDPPITFELVETLLWEQGYQRLDRHLARLAESAEYFDYPLDGEAVRTFLEERAASLTTGQRYKVRLLVSASGELRCEGEPLAPQTSPEHAQVALSSVPTQSRDRFLYHKTTHRPLYHRASQRAAEEGVVDVIFLNERGEVTEGATSNVFVEKGNILYTPPISVGLLCGIYRAWVLEQQPSAQEKILYLDDLQQADAIYICNDVRGWRRVTLAPTPLSL